MVVALLAGELLARSNVVCYWSCFCFGLLADGLAFAGPSVNFGLLWFVVRHRFGSVASGGLLARSVCFILCCFGLFDGLGGDCVALAGPSGQVCVVLVRCSSLVRFCGKRGALCKIKSLLILFCFGLCGRVVWVFSALAGTSA